MSDEPHNIERLTQEDKLVIGAFMNPKFPRRIRTVAGISKETGLTPVQIYDSFDRLGPLVLTDNEGRFQLNVIAIAVVQSVDPRELNAKLN